MCKTSHMVSHKKVLWIVNSNINKIVSREVFEHFYEPGFVADGSSILVLLHVDIINIHK